VSFIGIFIFDENIDLAILIGSTIVIGAGLYTFWRERIVEKQIE
jgi:drug/metabolite transporter (DMT)-like permease